MSGRVVPARARFQRKRRALGPMRIRATEPERTGESGASRASNRAVKPVRSTAFSRVGGSFGGAPPSLPAASCELTDTA